MALLLTVLVSCQDFKMQTDYKYTSSPLNPHIEMNAWEYMQSREDLSEMVEAVEFTGMQDYYTQTDRCITYLFQTIWQSPTSAMLTLKWTRYLTAMWKMSPDFFYTI